MVSSLIISFLSIIFYLRSTPMILTDTIVCLSLLQPEVSRRNMRCGQLIFLTEAQKENQMFWFK